MDIQDVSDLEMAFPANVKHLMPPMEAIPREFQNGHTVWNRLMTDWFCVGLKDLKLTPKEGVDTQRALRHLKAIIGSFEPSHEHKEAAVAYLLSQWFTDATWKRAKQTARV